ncbi:MAG: GspH/FimT family pseudopilin [Betaproteobacteria bacterium]
MDRPALPMSTPAAGFSLLELMVVLGLTLILATLALPSLRGLLVRWTLESEAQSLLDDLRYARTQAIVRGQAVSICPSVDGLGCAGQADWGRGWMIFLDADASRVAGAGKPVLRQHQPDPSVQTITSNGSSSRAGVTYQPTGAARAAGQSLRLTAGSSLRLVCISMQGRAALRPQGQTQCA